MKFQRRLNYYEERVSTLEAENREWRSACIQIETMGRTGYILR